MLAYFEENQEFYLVQEFIVGRPLSHELHPGQSWSESQVIVLLQDVLGILAFVHSYQTTRKDTGEIAIQVASFNNRRRAEVFSDFMNRKLGSGNVGQPTIYSANSSRETPYPQIALLSFLIHNLL